MFTCTPPTHIHAYDFYHSHYKHTVYQHNTSSRCLQVFTASHVLFHMPVMQTIIWDLFLFLLPFIYFFFPFFSPLPCHHVLPYFSLSKEKQHHNNSRDDSLTLTLQIMGTGSAREPLMWESQSAHSVLHREASEENDGIEMKQGVFAVTEGDVKYPTWLQS